MAPRSSRGKVTHLPRDGENAVTIPRRARRLTSRTLLAASAPRETFPEAPYFSTVDAPGIWR